MQSNSRIELAFKDLHHFGCIFKQKKTFISGKAFHKNCDVIWKIDFCYRLNHSSRCVFRFKNQVSVQFLQFFHFWNINEFDKISRTDHSLLINQNHNFTVKESVCVNVLKECRLERNLSIEPWSFYINLMKTG